MGELIRENIRVKRFEVDHNFVGWRLDEYLANRMEGMSRSLAGRVAREGNIAVLPKRKVKAGTRLRLDDIVILRHELPPEVVQDDEASILYEDEALLILNKPAGMLVHETATVRLNTITYMLQRWGKEGAEPAHRLDRETSGALVCAQTPEWVAPLRSLFASSDPEKVYRALAIDKEQRWLPNTKARIDIPLGEDSTSTLPMKVGVGPLKAVTHVLSLSRLSHPLGDLADLQIRIETGRQHQIRAHLFLQGTPIAGDKLYGQTDQFFMAACDRPDDPDLLSRLHFPRHALHAWRISLTHPLTGKRITVEAPLPALFQA